MRQTFLFGLFAGMGIGAGVGCVTGYRIARGSGYWKRHKKTIEKAAEGLVDKAKDQLARQKEGIAQAAQAATRAYEKAVS